MKINILSEKKILLLGLGVTTYETVIALEEYKKNMVIVEKDPNKNKYVESLKEKGYLILSEDELIDRKLDFDLILKSPGVPSTNIVLTYYNHVKVINDIELAYLYIKENKLDIKIVAVTATNGKTSTTLYIEKLLNNAGFSAYSAGNIGVSPLCVLNKKNIKIDYLILELSSFQLLNICEFKPDYSFILNITPDHLNIHPTFEHYVSAKRRIAKNQGKENFLFTKQKVYDKYLKEEKSRVTIVLNEVVEEVITNIDFYKYSGMNFNNLLLCYRFCQILNIDDKYFYKTLNEFEGLEHRVEFVSCLNGINFYNDSKATNLEATKESLKHLKNIILLVGGRSEADDLTNFNKYLTNVKVVICYGENKNKFISDKVVARVENLEEAVGIAKEYAKEGDSILLSPASKSFDQYKSYKVRGIHFKSLIREYW